MKKLTTAAAAVLTMITFVSGLMAAAIWRMGNHPIAFTHALLLSLVCGVIVFCISPFVV